MFSLTRMLLWGIGSISLSALAAPNSVYTPLDSKTCRIIQEDEHGSTSRCPAW